MSLGDQITAALPWLQTQAESLMVDTFVAYASELVVVDELEVRQYVEQYETLGKIAGRSRGDTETRTVTVGGVEREVLEGGLHIPFAAQTPLIGWEFACVAVFRTSDPSLLGRRWRVVSVPAKSYLTARRLDVVEITGAS